MNKKIIGSIVLLMFLGALCVAYVVQQKAQQQREQVHYQSMPMGISFSVPDGYFIAHEIDEGSGERIIRQIVLMADTPENRSLVRGEGPGRDGPPTINVGIYQNDLDHYSPEQFIKGTSYSNFKLSDGKLSETTIAGLSGLRYHATGLYENENIVVASPSYIYMFTVSFNSSAEKIISDFEDMIKTVTIK